MTTLAKRFDRLETRARGFRRCAERGFGRLEHDAPEGGDYATGRGDYATGRGGLRDKRRALLLAVARDESPREHA